MQVLNGLATLAFVIVGAAVGLRLLLLARRTRQIPELAVGTALLLIGGLGYPLAIAAGAPGLVAPKTGLALMAFATVVMDVGFACIVVFTWKVFRPEAPWARGLLVAMVLGYALHAVGTAPATLALENPSQVLHNMGWATLGQVLNAVAFLWATAESSRYWWMLRKRAALGLGDPVTTNRFLLWAIASSCSVVTNFLTWWVVIRGLEFFEESGIQAAVGVISLGSCIAQYLAFLPPRAYLERIRARAASA